MSTAAALLRGLVTRRWPPAPLPLVYTGAVLFAGGGLIAARAAVQSDALAAVIISPRATTLAPGGSAQFQVYGRSPSGRTIGVTVTWSATGGSVTSSGRYTTGAMAGRFLVIARAINGRVDTAIVTVNVNPPPPSPGGPSNGPEGCQLAYEDGYSALAGTGLVSSGVGPVSVNGSPFVTAAIATPDPTAPASPPNVLQVSFAPGWAGSAAPPVSVRRPLGAPHFSVYLSFWLRLDPSWPGPATGPDLAIDVGSGPTPAERVSLKLGRMVAGVLVADLRLAGLSRPFGGVTDPTLAANQLPSPPLTAGVWHRIEFLVVANGSAPREDGEVRWWLDGKLVGSYSGLGLFGGAVPAIRELGWSAAAPPTPLAATHTLRIDHWYASGWSGEPAGMAGEADKVVVTGDTPPPTGATLYGPATTLLLDARRQLADDLACVNDTTPDGPAVGDLRFRGSCPRDEVVVFSVGDRATLDPGNCGSGTIWTDDPGQGRKEQLGLPPIDVPVKLWTVNFVGFGTECTVINNGSSDGGPSRELATTTEIYNGHGAGIVFHFTDSTDLCGNTDARDALDVGGGGSDCNSLRRPLPYFTPGMINVYYVPNLLSNSKGINCRSVDPNVILISVGQRNATTLAHELGHALGLEHTGYYFVDTSPGSGGVPLYGAGTITGSNLMWANGPAKYLLTLGQAFRMNFESASQLNRNQTRAGPVRECECRLGVGPCTEAVFAAQSKVDGVCPRVPHPW